MVQERCRCYIVKLQAAAGKEPAQCVTAFMNITTKVCKAGDKARVITEGVIGASV